MAWCKIVASNLCRISGACPWRSVWGGGLPRADGGGVRGSGNKESTVGEVIHTSRLQIERVKGPIRQAFLEGFDTPIRFGVHGRDQEVLRG